MYYNKSHKNTTNGPLHNMVEGGKTAPFIYMLVPFAIQTWGIILFQFIWKITFFHRIPVGFDAICDGNIIPDFWITKVDLYVGSLYNSSNCLRFRHQILYCHSKIHPTILESCEKYRYIFLNKMNTVAGKITNILSATLISVYLCFDLSWNEIIQLKNLLTARSKIIKPL